MNLKTKLPDGKLDSELNQLNPYDKHPQLQESVCAHPLEALLDEHWYDTSKQFGCQHSMCHCNSGLHGQQGPTHHQNSARSNISRSETSKQPLNSTFH